MPSIKVRVNGSLNLCHGAFLYLEKHEMGTRIMILIYDERFSNDILWSLNMCHLCYSFDISVIQREKDGKKRNQDEELQQLTNRDQLHLSPYPNPYGQTWLLWINSGNIHPKFGCFRFPKPVDEVLVTALVVCKHSYMDPIFNRFIPQSTPIHPGHTFTHLVHPAVALYSIASRWAPISL